MRRSVFRNMLFGLLILGVLAGLAVPLLVGLFVDWTQAGSAGLVMAALGWGAVLGMLAYTLVKSQLNRPLAELNRSLGELSRGELRSRAELDSDDGFGELADHQRRLGGWLEESSVAIEQAMVSMRATHADLLKASSRGAKGQEQSQIAAQLVQTAETIRAESEQIGSRAGQAEGRAKAASEQSAQGAKAMRDSLDAVKTLATEVDQATQVIARLEAQSDAIGTVLDVIRGIADQTNLLALNAAIEAARAGEQGRGFAVVADEVRTLAQRTQHSTQEIQNMIEGLQAGAADAVAVMGRGRDHVARSLDSTKEAAASFDAMRDAVGQISAIGQGIGDLTSRTVRAIDELQGRLDGLRTQVANVDNSADRALGTRLEREIDGISAAVKGLLGAEGRRKGLRKK
ncbi:MAG: methyl-accepting chemotaxis protein [Chromatiales bacterium]|nr:methyl-accepting chemotaxis protein [Chromatiales bacterium]